MVYYYIVAHELNRRKTLLVDVIDENDIYSKSLTRINEELNDLKKYRELQLRELEITNERIKNHSSMKDELLKKLKNLDLKRREIKMITDNAIIITPIFVDEISTNYKLTNGLVTANRDVIMKLLRVIREETKIRTVFLYFFLYFFILCFKFLKFSFQMRLLDCWNGRNFLCLVKTVNFSLGEKSTRFFFFFFSVIHLFYNMHTTESHTYFFFFFLFFFLFVLPSFSFSLECSYSVYSRQSKSQRDCN
jgi:hypothetical protein